MVLNIVDWMRWQLPYKIETAVKRRKERKVTRFFEGLSRHDDITDKQRAKAEKFLRMAKEVYGHVDIDALEAKGIHAYNLDEKDRRQPVSWMDNRQNISNISRLNNAVSAGLYKMYGGNSGSVDQIWRNIDDGRIFQRYNDITVADGIRKNLGIQSIDMTAHDVMSDVWGKGERGIAAVLQYVHDTSGNYDKDTKARESSIREALFRIDASSPEVNAGIIDLRSMLTDALYTAMDAANRDANHHATAAYLRMLSTDANGNLDHAQRRDHVKEMFLKSLEDYVRVNNSNTQSETSLINPLSGFLNHQKALKQATGITINRYDSDIIDGIKSIIDRYTIGDGLKSTIIASQGHAGLDNLEMSTAMRNSICREFGISPSYNPTSRNNSRHSRGNMQNRMNYRHAA